MKLSTLTAIGDQDQPYTQVTALRENGASVRVTVYEALPRTERLIIEIDGEFPEITPEEDVAVYVNDASVVLFDPMPPALTLHERVIAAVKDLRSEAGVWEHREYTRALVDLAHDLLGGEREDIEDEVNG